MALLANPAASVSFLELAPLLGLPCAGRAFPCRTTCPGCGGIRLTIHQDSIEGGHWHHCPDCGRSGDMIELAALVWEVHLDTALARLAGHGFFDRERIAVYHETHQVRRAAVAGLWKDCRDYIRLIRDSELDRLRAELMVTSKLAPDRWDQGPGRLLGGHRSDQVHRALSLHGPSAYRETRGHNSADRLIARRPAQSVLVLPYHVVPGRIGAFLFVGCNRGEITRGFWPHWQANCVTKFVEAGLWGLEQAFADRRFPPYVIALSDPVLGARLQIRHHAMNRQSLPLVAWYDDGGKYLTTSAWGALGHRQIIFWDLKLTGALVRQAVLTDGMIALTTLEDQGRERIGHYMRLSSPEDMFKKIIKAALPWREALARWGRTADRGAVEDVLLALEGYLGFDPRPVAEALDAADRFALPRRRQAQVLPYAVYDRADGWWYANHSNRRPDFPAVHDPLLLSEATVVIDAIQGGDTPRYIGRIMYRGAEVPFNVAAVILDRPMGWQFVTDKCMHAGLGHPRTQGTNRLTPATVALAFREPLQLPPGATITVLEDSWPLRVPERAPRPPRRQKTKRNDQTTQST